MYLDINDVFILRVSDKVTTKEGEYEEEYFFKYADLLENSL